nr:unnamed protein product [Spirometra erinaceieuropaei]
MSPKFSEAKKIIQERLYAISPEALVEKVAQKIAGVKNVITSEAEEEVAAPLTSPRQERERVIYLESSKEERTEVIHTDGAYPGFSGRPLKGLISTPIDVVVTAASESLDEDSSLLHSQSLPSLLFTPTQFTEKIGGLQSLLSIRRTPLGEETIAKEDSFWSDDTHSRPSLPSTLPYTSREITPLGVGIRQSDVPTPHSLKEGGPGRLEVTGRHYKPPPPLEIRPRLAKYHERYGALPPLQGRTLAVHSLEPSDSLVSLTPDYLQTSSLLETEEGEGSGLVTSVSPKTPVEVSQPLTPPLPILSASADATDSSVLAVPEEQVMDWYVKCVAEGNLLQKEQVPPASLPTIKQSKRSFYFAAKLSSMPVDEELCELEVEKTDALGSPETLHDSLATSRSSAAQLFGPRKSNLLQAARNLLEFDKHTMHMASGNRKREIKRQLRMNRIIQQLRKKLRPTEIAELFSDLYTRNPSKRTEILLEETGKIVDAMTK